MIVKELLERGAKFYTDRIAVVDGNRRITYGEAWNRGIRLANGLLAMGIRPQDKIGVLEDNGLESSDVYIGLAVANMVRVPLYSGSPAQIHTHMLSHTGCTALIASSRRLQEVDLKQSSLSLLKHIIVVDEEYENWLLSQSDKLPQILINPDDVFIIRHSGGTSGLPKGVGITHRRWIIQMRDWFFPLPPIAQGDSFLHISPISHASGYMFLPVWANGGCNVFLPDADPVRCLEVLKREKGNFIFVPPTQLSSLVKMAIDRNELKWPYLKAIMIGGASVPARTLRNLRTVFGDVLYQSYGQTEAGIVAMGSPLQWRIEKKQDSCPAMACGLPLNFADIKIIENDKEQPYGQSGEIVVRTDGMMDHYWGMEHIPVNGWIYTGDMGKFDKYGYLYILGRKEDMITVGDNQIFPLELENIICSESDVLEAAVVRTGESGQQISIVCVAEESVSAAEEKIVKICRENLQIDGLQINLIITTKPLPKNSIGKTDRKAIKI